MMHQSKVGNKKAKRYAFTSLLKGSKNLDEDLINALYPHNKQVWPFMNGYELEARFMADDNINAMQLIENCWGNLKYKETGTFWELFDIYNNEFSVRPFSLYDTSDSYNSECHGWSGLVSSMMQQYILGVRPLEPGFKKTIIEPHIYNLKCVNGTVPTPSGEISVNINFKNSKWIIEIYHPKDLEIEFSKASSCFDGYELEVKINGKEFN